MQSLQRGVKIRIVSEKLTSVNMPLSEIMEIEKQAGAVTRFLSTPPPALILLSDEKEVLIITSATGTLETSALWSKNPSLIALAKIYFDNVWQSASISIERTQSANIVVQKTIKSTISNRELCR